MSKLKRLRADLLICIALVAAVAFVYWQATDFKLLNMDDDRYVEKCPPVQEGLTLANVRWALTTFYQLNWHPLTWISLMADTDLGDLASDLNVAIWGPEAGVYHFTNILLHMANAVLLFVLLFRVTGFRWRSAFVAALFAVHPLHVESVAWVTERKDVLSTLFWLLTMLAYVGYVKKPSIKRYVLTTVLFGLGLMAKPMLVTLPLVLLMMDVWPLGRLDQPAKSKKPKPSIWPLVREKGVLLVMSAASSWVTFRAQNSGGAVVPVDVITISHRVSNAFVSALAYMLTMFWPVKLAPVYPYDIHGPEWPGVVCAIVLVALSIGAYKASRRKERAYAGVGWLWYLVTLIPVIGLIQVGSGARADRYTYIPLIGLFIVIAWGVPDLASRLLKGIGERQRGVALAVAAIVVLAPLGWTARGYASHWKDSIALFSYAVRATKPSAFSEVNLASALSNDGDLEGGILHARRALEIAPYYSLAEYTLGTTLRRQGNVTEAEYHLRRCLAITPNDPIAHNNLGALLVEEGKIDEGIEHFKVTLALDPTSISAQHNLEQALAIKERQGR